MHAILLRDADGESARRLRRQHHARPRRRRRLRRLGPGRPRPAFDGADWQEGRTDVMPRP